MREKSLKKCRADGGTGNGGVKSHLPLALPPRDNCGRRLCHKFAKSLEVTHFFPI
jgi:hypothetical protein